MRFAPAKHSFFRTMFALGANWMAGEEFIDGVVRQRRVNSGEIA
jgi:hypothetical protein